MLNSLYIKAASKRGSIKEIIPELEGNSIVSDNWNEKNITGSDDEFSIGAGDGSFNKKKFLGFNFYAVAAESLIFDGQLKTIEQSDIDKFPYLPYLDEFLSNYMSIFELKCCLSSLEEYNVDYYLIDGSIYGDLQNPFPRGVETSAKAKKDLISATLNDFEDGSGSYTAEPSIILYDLKTGKETLILNGTENSGLYTVPAGADEDHLYLLQQPFNDSDIDGRCTYLQYDLKEQTMEPLYESRVKDSQIIADNTLYIQPDNEHRLVKYNLKTQKQEDVLDWDASVDKVWVIDRDLILLIKETRSEDSSKIQYVNWYDLKEQQYLFDEYSDYTTLEVMGKTEKGFLVWKEDELYFYTPDDHHWEKIEEIS